MPDISQPIFVYITAPDSEVSQLIGLGLVQERLAACVNIVPGMTSIYRWQGKIEQAQEIVLIAKTTNDRFEALSAFVKSHHPYEVPCIVALPLAAGNRLISIG